MAGYRNSMAGSLQRAAWSREDYMGMCSTWTVTKIDTHLFCIFYILIFKFT